MTTHYIGIGCDRVDGRAKVTGSAKYAAEYQQLGLAHGWVVGSTVARGKISRLDVNQALAVPGVLEVFSHENAPRLAALDEDYKDQIAVPGVPLRPLHDSQVYFSGQPVALVVAEHLESARYAATLVRFEYEPENHCSDFAAARARAYEPPEQRGEIGAVAEPRGDAERVFAQAALRHEGEYYHPIEHHNAMELFASTAVWEGDGRITIYEKTQGTQNNQGYVAQVFGYEKDDVRVIARYVGGAYGSGLRPQYQLFLAVMAARALKRSVRVALTRQQMFTIGYRPATLQRVALAAERDGSLSAIIHEATGNTSRYEDYQEGDVNWAGVLYRCANTKFAYKLVKLDLQTPIDMRAPGGSTGMYALECALDELAVELQMDPVELRLKNYSDKDQEEDLPFSSKELRACYQQGAERFGWSRRTPQPRSMRDGDRLVGWGMAGGIWEALQQPASARAVLSDDGKLVVSSATADIGTGTYTVMSQIAAERLGVPFADVSFVLGDSALPPAPVEGGSFTVATVGSAVAACCDKLRPQLFALAKKLVNSPFAEAQLGDVYFADGQLRLGANGGAAIAISTLLRQAGVDKVEAQARSGPTAQQKNYARYAHSAVFCEVKVDADLGSIEVSRVVSAVAGGRIINPKTARSQIIGGIVWGIGMALQEEAAIDHRFGRIMNHNLAEYHVPVNADVEDLEVIFVDEQDDVVNPLGVKGLGEIGLVGVAAAIANAVFHATGKRVRDLPITLDKLL